MTLDEFEKLSVEEMRNRINWVYAAENELTPDEQALIDAHEEKYWAEQVVAYESLPAEKRLDPDKLKIGPKSSLK